MDSYTRAGFIIGITLLTILGTTLIQQVYAAIEDGTQIRDPIFFRQKAPIATSGDNVYVTWWSNKTGNDEVMFKASTDNGKKFGEKMNLSNSANSNSQDAQIVAYGNNVFISSWERANQTSNERVLSTDSGKTCGPIQKLAANGTIGITGEG